MKIAPDSTFHCLIRVYDNVLSDLPSSLLTENRLTTVRPAVLMADMVVPVCVVVMLVLVPAVRVAVAVSVGEIPLAEPLFIADYFTRRAFSDDPLVLPENINPVSKLADEMQVMGRCDDSLTLFALLYDDIDEVAAAPQVKSGRRLVKKQHVGFERHHASDRHPLLLADAQLVRRAALQMSDPEHCYRIFDPP